VITTPIGNKKLLMSHNISVVNAQLSDEGTYKCMAFDLADNHKVVTKLIKVYG